MTHAPDLVKEYEDSTETPVAPSKKAAPKKAAAKKAAAAPKKVGAKKAGRPAGRPKKA